MQQICIQLHVEKPTKTV